MPAFGESRPEPPRFHPSVGVALALARRLHRQALVTPHSCGGSTADRIQYEYDGASAFLGELTHHLPPGGLKGRTVLDVGCGWGGKAVYYAGHTNARRVVGIDLPGFDAAAAREFARGRGVASCQFQVGVAEVLPYRDESFDVVLSEDVFEHVQNPPAALAEAYRVLRPGGVFVAVFPSFRQANAHHLDRAINLPGLHYVLSMKTWASGLNHVRMNNPGVAWAPFDEVVKTPYRRVTCNLNGMSFGQFSALVRQTSFEVETLALVPRRYSADRWLMSGLYRLAVRLAPWLREFLADHILFVGRRPASPSHTKPATPVA